MLDNLRELHKKIIKVIINLNLLGNIDIDDYFIINQEEIINLSYNIMFFKILKNKLNYIDEFTLEKVFCTGNNRYNQIDIEDDINHIFFIEDLEIIINILENYHINRLNSIYLYENGNIIKKKSKTILKSKGAFYTPERIANYISIKTIERSLIDGIALSELKILDFGCGTGRFIIEAMKYLKLNYNIDYITQIENNIYAIDIDEVALDITKLKIISLISDKDIVTKVILKLGEIIIKKNILFDGGLYENNFDIKKIGINTIISNPPYYQLKVNDSDKLNKIEKKYNEELKIKIKNEVEFFRNSGEYQYSTEGMLNYYKLSIEKMIKIISKGGNIGIICPSTIFGDLNAKKLRKHMLLDNKIYEINYYSEKAGLFDGVSQSTVIFFLKKGSKTDQIEIGESEGKFNIGINTINNLMGEKYEIPYIEKIGRDILKKLEKYPKVSNIKNIRNKRGELDLTLHKKYITTKNTGYNLIRGSTIGEVDIRYDKIKEFVDVDLFKKIKSYEYLNNDFNKIRLVCNQISNIDTKKRLKFVLCSKNDIMGNSCNYITLNDNKNIRRLKILLNSFLLNWRFTITSSNNHINNYELDELPIAENFLFDGKETDNIIIQNILICKYYDLNIDECIYILSKFFNSIEIIKNAKGIYL